jgi:hypothetical protein
MYIYGDRSGTGAHAHARGRRLYAYLCEAFVDPDLHVTRQR